MTGNRIAPSEFEDAYDPLLDAAEEEFNDRVVALTTSVLAAHVMTDASAGNGYTEPREAWVSCSCGTTVWAWQQYYEETDEDPELAKRTHLSAMSVRAALENGSRG